MTTLICKICGGQIRTTGQTWGVCDSCGTEVTLPKIDDAIRGEFYNRANYFRANREFDRAYSEFEHIIAQDPNDAEAYWSLVLCKYGVIYEHDPDHERYELLVTDVRQEPVWEDMDYQRALRNSDEHTKSLYRAEAGKIDAFQEYYFSLVRREQPYDVFLCVKTKDDAGQLTLAGDTAQTIYEKLTEKGIRVFCEDSLTMRESKAEREARVAFALSSAKILFAITGGNDDLNSCNVRRQWTRFMDLMTKDRSKKIVPVYRGTQIYAIPEQIPSHEAICADQAGYWQDLTWGVQQILGKEERRAPEEAGAEEYLKEAKAYFEAGNFNATALMAEQAMNCDPDNAYAHFYAFMAKYKVRQFDQLLGINENWAANTTLQRIIDLGNGELREQALAFRTEYCNRIGYHSAKNAMSHENYAEAIRYLEPLGDYADAPTLLEQCRKLDHHQKMLRQYQQETQNDPNSHLFLVIDNDYKEEAGTFLEMLGDVAVTPKAKYPPAQALICAVIMIAISLFHMIVAMGKLSYEIASWVSTTSLLFEVVAVIYGLAVCRSKWTAAILFALSFAAAGFFVAEVYDGVDNLIIALIPLVDYLRQSRRDRKYKSLVEKMENYNKEVIMPLEKKIVKDIHHRYGDVLSKEEIGKFYPFKTVAIQTIERIMKEK